MLIRRLNQRTWSPRRTALIVGVGVLLLLGALVYLAAPTLLWAYNVEQAGVLMDRGLLWPEPRVADSLPQQRDGPALDAALGHLAAALAWRPTDAHARRLAGEIYAARGDWQRAAETLSAAQQYAPHNPMIALETGLAYEQLTRALEQAPRESLMDAFARGGVEAPGVLVRSLFCNDSGAASCYFGRTQYTQRFAGTNERAQTLPVLFLHAPAQLKQRVSIPATTPILDFVVGLDPVARDWPSDGATLRVLVEDPPGTETVVYERTVSHALAAQGWLRGDADLRRWVGREVVLVLETGAGPAGDFADDWFGWADVALAVPVASQPALAALRAQTRAAWQAGGFGGFAFEQRGKEARNADQPGAAQAWFRRADLMAGR